MKKRWKINILKEQRGSALLIVSITIIVLLSIAALVIDLGSLFVSKTHLKKTANAAVLSAAQELVNSETAVQSILNSVLQAHNEVESLVNTTINQGYEVSVALRKQVSLTFSKLLGFDSSPVEAVSTAQILQMGRGTGAAPIGIDESFEPEFNKTYKLKVDQTEVDTGNFGVLALDGPGAQTYEDNLRYGYSGEIKVGDIINTQTGNIAGKTRTVINEKINACPYPPGDLDHRDCPRILLVPVYRPNFYTNNQLKNVEIVGFAFFYILEPMSNTDTSITGMFIKRVDTGYTDSNAVNRGAFSIKLTE